MSRRIYITIILSIYLFKSINNQNCTSIKPEIRYDCLQYSNPEGFCCYNSAENICESVGINDLKNHPKLDCGVTEENYGLYEFDEYHPRHELKLPFQACGEQNPEKKEDCLEYSEMTNTCCFFQDTNGKKGCFLIGKRYSGDSKEKSYMNNNALIKYQCNSFYMEFQFYLILFLLILFF